MTDFSTKHCQPCQKDTPAYDEATARQLLADIQGWSLSGKHIEREFHFKNYYETIAFVNAVAWLAHQDDHHPHMTVSYNRCLITYTTHAIGGLSENDFICAAKINLLLNKTA